MRFGVSQLPKLDYTEVFKVATLVTDVLLARVPNIMITGHYTVVDMKNLGPSQIISPTMARQVGKLFVGAYAIRPQHLIFINASPIIEILMNFLNPFLSEKMKKRVIFTVYIGYVARNGDTGRQNSKKIQLLHYAQTQFISTDYFSLSLVVISFLRYRDLYGKISRIVFLCSLLSSTWCDEL